MGLSAFTHGVVLATGLIVAFGPQNVFIFQQGAVQPHFTRALPTVFTASLADTVLIVLSVLGASIIVLQFAWLQTVLFGAGFIFLLYVGWALFTSPSPVVDPNTTDFLGVREQIGFTASVSLLNPHALLDTFGVIATNALAYSGQDRWLFTGGCLLISWGWFSGLAATGAVLGNTDRAVGWLQHLNTVSAVLIWLVALYMGWQFLLLSVL